MSMAVLQLIGYTALDNACSTLANDMHLHLRLHCVSNTAALPVDQYGIKNKLHDSQNLITQNTHAHTHLTVVTMSNSQC